MNNNPMLNSKLNLQNNQFQISNHPKIQEAFKLILSELNHKNLKIKELEDKINILQFKIKSIENNIKLNSPLNNSNNQINNNNIQNMNYNNNNISFENNQKFTPSISNSFNKNPKIEVKKYLEEVKLRVNGNIFKKFIEKIKLLNNKNANYNKNEIMNEIGILFGEEYYDLYEKLEKIIGKKE